MALPPVATEVYIHLIKQALDEHKQVLYLLPEIALTVQIMERLHRVFGDRLGIYHSKYSDAERVEIWQKQMSGHPYDVILGHHIHHHRGRTCPEMERSQRRQLHVSPRCLSRGVIGMDSLQFLWHVPILDQWIHP